MSDNLHMIHTMYFHHLKEAFTLKSTFMAFVIKSNNTI